MTLTALKEFIESRAGMTLLMFVGLMMFSSAVVFCAISLPQNERIYLFLATIAGNFSGSLFTILHISSKTDKP